MHHNSNDTHRLKAKGYNKIFQTGGIQQKSELLIIISDKIDSKSKTAKTKKDIT